MATFDQLNRTSYRLARAIGALSDLTRAIKAPLPMSAAEMQMDDIGDHITAIQAKLLAAQALVDAELDLVAVR
jgi:hypothetical protein